MSEDPGDPGPGNTSFHPHGELPCPGYALFPIQDIPGAAARDPFAEEDAACLIPGDTVSGASPGASSGMHGGVLPRSRNREPGPAYDIMVDGSGDGHSIALFPGEEVYFSYERGASNNDAEFNAVILALENLPLRAHARICTDSQVVVWHLSSRQDRRNATYLRKKVKIEDLIACRQLKVEIQWIPRKENRADRFLKHYIASLCGVQGREPLHRRVRRLEVENLRLKARLKKAIRMLEQRPVVFRDSGMVCKMAKVPEMFPENR